MSSKSSTDKEANPMAEVNGADEAGMQEAVSAEVKPEAAKKAAKDEAKPAEKKGGKDEAKAVKKTASKKSAAKKADKPELKPELYVEYQGRQATGAAVVDKVKAAFVASGHRASSIKSLQIYIKPEEFKAYYVINDGKYTGGVDLF